VPKNGKNEASNGEPSDDRGGKGDQAAAAAGLMVDLHT
jgi:hypothetical protein